jgi:pescadillo protein
MGGNREKGKPKKKSIKAALGSNAGSKRKLSRMGKKQKKHNSGLEASFIGRSRCLRMLQLPLKDFRRLCILKGIYPREPIGRVPGDKKGQTFYHIKDIRAIAHEPVMEKFREFRAFMKKVRCYPSLFIVALSYR